ncbi:DNA polymerase-3 subunit gamma/tau [Lachnospiraceae bacterium NE2001]|nr:DNA polymerase-3 subunit gamma/tau [Lachnospiraceae bacterium NE2001]
MSYLALYRKFRPDSFEEVKGQEHVVTTLKNQIAHNRVGHAYLLRGTRGTGKTTIAKLMAKTMNCEHPTEAGPCGVCDSCKAIADGSSLNVIEIDAATHSGVDYMRQINETVQYAPANGKYLVYIIDEAHQLSNGAFNALLKTMEEPPEYVIFILATTDDEKLPITIKSRCQVFDFHRIPIETIADRLEDIVGREGETAERDALLYIARLADGSLRDALSILDECLSANVGQTLNRDMVLSTVGAVSVDIYIRLFEAMTGQKADEVLEIINESIWSGKDLTKFTDDLTWFVRNMLFLKLSPGLREELDLTTENADRLLELGKQYTVETLAEYLTTLQYLSADIRKSTVKRVTLETTLIKLMYPEARGDYESLARRLDKLEKMVANGAVGAPGTAGAALGGRLSDVDATNIDALVDAKLKYELDKKVSEKYEQIKAIAMETNSMKRVKVDDVEEKRQAFREKLNSEYPPATAKELNDIFCDRWDEIVGKLSPIKQDLLNYFKVVPSSEYGQDGRAELVIKVRKTSKEKGHLRFYAKDPDMLAQLSKDISQLIGKDVKVIAKDDDESSTEDKRNQDSFNLFLEKGLLVDVLESEE